MDRSSYRRDIFVASDGVAVRDNNDLVSFYDASGTLINSFEVTRYLKGIANGDQTPTLEELQAFLKSGKTPWATGTVEVRGSARTPRSPSHRAGNSRIVHGTKGLSHTSSEPCYSNLTDRAHQPRRSRGVRPGRLRLEH